MIPLQFLSKFIKILRSAASPSQIAGGFILGMFLGMLPNIFNPIAVLLILLIIILNVNISTAIFSFAIFSGIAYLFDPLLHSLGFFVLVDITALKPLWVSLYNAPVIPYTRFNNTVAMGSILISIILLVPSYFAVKSGIVKYREKYEPKVQKMKWMKLMKSSQIYQLYEKIKLFGD